MLDTKLPRPKPYCYWWCVQMFCCRHLRQHLCCHGCRSLKIWQFWQWQLVQHLWEPQLNRMSSLSPLLKLGSVGPVVLATQVKGSLASLLRPYSPSLGPTPLVFAPSFRPFLPSSSLLSSVDVYLPWSSSPSFLGSDPSPFHQMSMFSLESWGIGNPIISIGIFPKFSHTSPLFIVFVLLLLFIPLLMAHQLNPSVICTVLYVFFYLMNMD